MSTLAFIGTGTMGFPMARNLAKSGFDVRAWNRTRERAEPLREHGAVICHSAAGAAAEAAVMITMLSAADAVLDVAPAALKALPHHGVWIQMSTIGVEATEQCMQLAQDANVPFIDAPVLGTVAPAEKGELVVLASGEHDQIESCERIFDALGSKTVRAGSAGNGSRLKLVANSWLLGLTGVLAESVGLARTLEVDPKLFLEAIAGGSVDSPYAHIKGENMLAEDYSKVDFRLDLAHKDAGLALAAAKARGARLRLLDEVSELQRSAIESGHGEQDMSAVATAVAGGRDGSR